VRPSAVRLIPWAVVLLAPVLGIVALRAPLINQLGYVDPWIYAGYGWTFAHHIEVLGWHYYPDRFTVILPIAGLSGLLGPIPAYIVLRYLLMAGCGALLYLAIRRFGSVPVAVAAVCLVMLNPFFVRMLTWDYPTFVMLPCTIAGVALWYLGSTRVRALWTALGAGICLSAAIYANPAAGLVLPPLIGVESIAAMRGGRRDVITIVLRGFAMATGALLVLAVGYLGYRAYLGSFSLKLMFQDTISFIRSNSQLAPHWQVAPSIFLRIDPYIYAPVLVCVVTVIILGRSLLSNTLRGRMAQFALAYTLVFWVYRFTVPSYVLEYWYYYNMTAVTVAFAMPAILDEIGQRCGRARWLAVAGIAIVVTGLIDLVIRSTDRSALNVFHYVRAHIVVMVCVLVACCIPAVLVTVLRRDAARLIALAVFCAIAATSALVPGGENLPGEFSADGTTSELDAYGAAYDMTQLIAKYDRPSSRVLLWDDLDGFGNVGWVDIPDEGGGIDKAFIPHRIPVLTSYELDMLRYPTTSRVLAVSDSGALVVSAVRALQKQGLGPGLETRGVWAGGRLHYALITLHTG
jgi:4-amino-4-deoxy-L-arabinose transferase-like glycosyltransferase